MAEQYCCQALRIVVAQIADSVGWQSIHQNALDTLVDVLRRRLMFLGTQCHDYSQLASRTQSNLCDLAMVFHMTNCSLHDLKEYVAAVESIPFPHQVPQITHRPIRCWLDHGETDDDFNDMQCQLSSDDDDEEGSPKEYIPSFLPPFPSENDQAFMYPTNGIDVGNFQSSCLLDINSEEHSSPSADPLPPSVDADERSVMPSSVASQYMQDGYASLPAEETVEPEEAFVDIVSSVKPESPLQNSWSSSWANKHPNPLEEDCLNRSQLKAKEKMKVSKASSLVSIQKTKNEAKKGLKPSKPSAKRTPGSRKSNKETVHPPFSLPLFSTISTKGEVSSMEPVSDTRRPPENCAASAQPALVDSSAKPPIPHVKVRTEKPKKKKKLSGGAKQGVSVHISFPASGSSVPQEDKQEQKTPKKKKATKKKVIAEQASLQAPTVGVAKIPTVMQPEDNEGVVEGDLPTIQPEPSSVTAMTRSLPQLQRAVIATNHSSLQSKPIIPDVATHHSLSAKKKKKKKKLKEGESPAKSEKKSKKKHRLKEMARKVQEMPGVLLGQSMTLQQQSDVYEAGQAPVSDIHAHTATGDPVPPVAADSALMMPSMPPRSLAVREMSAEFAAVKGIPAELMAVKAVPPEPSPIKGIPPEPSPVKKKKKKKRKHLEEDGPEKKRRVSSKKKAKRPQNLCLPTGQETSQTLNNMPPPLSPSLSQEQHAELEGSSQKALFSVDKSMRPCLRDVSLVNVKTSEVGWTMDESAQQSGHLLPSRASPKDLAQGASADSVANSIAAGFPLTSDLAEGQSLGLGVQSSADKNTPAQVAVGTGEQNVGSSVYFCPMCHLPDDGSVMISCDRCDTDVWYHIKCVGLKEPPSNNQHWYCPPCKKATKKSKKKHSHHTSSAHSSSTHHHMSSAHPSSTHLPSNSNV